MTYQEAVTQAASALTRGEDANWELARLTYENTFTSGDVKAQPTRVSMERWCADIRAASGRQFSYTTGNRYKAIWVRHGLPLGEDRPSWTDAWEDVHGGPSPAVAFAGINAERITDNATPDVKRDLAVKLMADPDVADAVIAQPATRRAVYESLNRREQAADTHRERIIDADPVSSGLRGLNAIAEMDTVLGRFIQEFTDTFRQMAALPPGDPFANREFLTLRLNHAQECLDQLRSYLDTGKTDIDAFLESVLKGGS